MLKKDLGSRLSKINPKPALACLYEKAHKDVYGTKTFVPENKFSLFQTFSEDLRDEGIDEKKYAYGIARLLKDWLATKSMKSIPITMFCGDWCLGRYRVIQNSETVDIGKENEEDELMYSELMVARYYISKNLGDDPYKFKDAVEDLMPMLSKKWLKQYKEKSIAAKFRLKAVDTLADEFCIGISKDYNDIIGKLRCN